MGKQPAEPSHPAAGGTGPPSEPMEGEPRRGAGAIPRWGKVVRKRVTPYASIV